MINESVKRIVEQMGVVLEGPNAGGTNAYEHLQHAHDSLSSQIAELARRGKDHSKHSEHLKHLEELQAKMKDSP